MIANRQNLGRAGLTSAVSRRPATATVEPLEGRRLLAGQVTSLELWTAGNVMDNKIFDIGAGFKYDTAAPGNTAKLDLKIATTGVAGGTPVKFEVYSPSFGPGKLISTGTERTAPYAIGTNDPNQPLNFFGKLRGPEFFGEGNEAPDYSLLRLGTATSKAFTVRVQIGGQSTFREFQFTLTRGGTVTNAPVLTSVKLVNAAGNPLAGTGDGTVKLDGSTVFNGVLNKKFSLVIAGTNLASAKLNLTNDGVAAAHGENAAPFSLYGDSGGTYVVKAVTTPGTYTLVLDLFSAKNFGGLTLHQEVSFKIAS